MQGLLYGVRGDRWTPTDESNKLMRGLSRTPMRLEELERPKLLRDDWCVAKTRLTLPGKRVAQARTAAALDANAESAIVDALLGHQGANFASGDFTDLNHGSIYGHQGLST